MRFPYPSVSLLWCELEVNATCLDKASCLDSIISYYSVLRTQDLPKGHLSLSLSRTSATRGCLGTRTEASLPWLWLSAAEGLIELAMSSRHWRDTDKLSSPHLIIILSVPISVQGAHRWITLEKFFWCQPAASWFHWMLVLPWTVKSSK